MEEGILTPGAEFEEIVRQLKHLLTSHREMGLDPPHLAPSTLEYLEGGSSHFDFDTLGDLRAFMGECRRCKLAQGRTHLIFGEGASRARLVFVGDGPGREEDLEGRPFAGEAGGLLSRIIKAMGLAREAVYVCNVVKCRPPHNRDPEEDEIKACLPFLKQQIRMIRPAAICALGPVAAQVLLDREFKMTRDRGQWQSFMGIPLMPTYHPAHILSNPAKERELKGHVWADVQEIMKVLGSEDKKG